MANPGNEGVQQPAAAKKAQTRGKKVAWEISAGTGQMTNAAVRHPLTVERARPAAGSVSVVREYYAWVYAASPEDRILMIRQGVPASDAKRIIKDLGVEQKVFYPALGLNAATVNRKVRRNDPLSSDESERLLGVAKLVGQLETIVSESGESEGFKAAEWMSRWLREPLPALGGKEPISFLDTMEGQALVSEALARIQSGAYA